MARRIEPQLNEYGCDMTSGQFQAFVDDTFEEHKIHDTVDEMLLHPDDAKAYCNTVRDQGKEFAALPDSLILRTLINYRKSGKKGK